MGTYHSLVHLFRAGTLLLQKTMRTKCTYFTDFFSLCVAFSLGFVENAGVADNDDTILVKDHCYLQTILYGQRVVSVMLRLATSLNVFLKRRRLSCVFLFSILWPLIPENTKET